MTIEKLNDSEFETYLKSNEKVVVKFMADWCGSCKLFAPKFKRLAEDEKYKGIKFIEINAEENENARRLSGVDNLPFIALFKSGEKIEGRATAKEEKVIELIETHLV
jgi:thioredoxin 1